MENGSHATIAPPSRWARAAGLLVAASLVVHFAATFLWVAEPVARDAVEPALTRYMTPLFDQDWSLFAPNPRFVDTGGSPQMLVRARLEDPRTGRVEVTNWINVSPREQSRKHHDPLAPRSTWLSSELGFRSAEQRQDLSSNQLSVTRGDYSRAGWEKLRADLGRQPGARPDDIDGYVDQDRTIAAAATQYARTVWGRGVRAVQVRFVYTMVPPFENQRAAPKIRYDELGWRAAIILPGQSERLFRDYVKRVLP